MSLTRQTAPAKLPVTLNQVRAHLRLPEGETAEDGDLAEYIMDAVETLDGSDGLLNRALITQTWDMTFDEFPRTEGIIRLPLPPMQSITSITYIDPDGVTQTWDSSEYRVLNIGDPWRRGEIEESYNESFPGTRNVRDAVTVRFVAGYGDSWNDVPAGIRQMIKLMVAESYMLRAPVNIGNIVNDLPAFRRRLALYKFGGMA